MQAFEHLRSFISQFNYPIFSYVYNSDGNVNYAGIAERGSSKGDPAWLIAKYTYNSDGSVSDVRLSERNSIFNNAAVLNYA